jgi:hypothetical protein
VEKLTGLLARCEFTNPLYAAAGGAVILLLVLMPLRRSRRGIALHLQWWKRQVDFKSRRLPVLSILAAMVSIPLAGTFSDPRITLDSVAAIYGKPVMTVVDVSGSMEAKPSRRAEDQRTSYEKALGTFLDLIGRRPDANFGLLLYSTEHYIARHFSYKNELFADTLDNKEEVLYISTGTRTAEALAKAREFLTTNTVKEADKAILLISDLEVDADEMLRMAEEIERELMLGIKVYIIFTGGGESGELAEPVSQREGLTTVEMSDEYGIDQICKEISEMELSAIREEAVPTKRSLSPLLIGPAMGIISLCLVLSETRFRKIP